MTARRFSSPTLRKCRKLSRIQMRSFESYDLMENRRFETRAVHAGQKPDKVSGAIVPALSMSTTFKMTGPGEMLEFDYARSGNPNRSSLEACLASLEKAKFCSTFGSGLAACTSVLNGVLKPGDHAIVGDDVYGGVNRLFREVAIDRFGIEVTFANLTDLNNFHDLVKPNTKIVWLETPTNPMLKIVDLKKLSLLCKEQKLLLAVDNTFATPCLQQPLEFGCDIVIHSVTKYLNGHSDVVMGCVMTNDSEIASEVAYVQNACGAIPSPFDCYMTLRGLKTLHLRVERQCRSAMKIAEYLESHPAIERVLYPFLPSHPQCEVAKSQMFGGGGVVTFFLKGGFDASREFLDKLKIFKLAVSLGAVESLAEHPASMTHANVPLEHRKELGIMDNLCRVAVGVENVDDLLEDLSYALSKTSYDSN